MKRLVTIRSYPQGPRVWLLGQRIHHGATGALLAALAGRRHHRLLALAAILCLHDRRDLRRWFAREGLPLTSEDHLR